MLLGECGRLVEEEPCNGCSGIEGDEEVKDAATVSFELWFRWNRTAYPLQPTLVWKTKAYDIAGAKPLVGIAHANLESVSPSSIG